jgi:hypothetical protein
MGNLQTANQCTTSDPSELPLNDWLNLSGLVRERRNRLFGEDLFLDPAWAILLMLGKTCNYPGAKLQSLNAATGFPIESLRRWIAVLVDRGFVEMTGEDLFALSEDGRDRLGQVYSH